MQDQSKKVAVAIISRKNENGEDEYAIVQIMNLLSGIMR